MKRSAEAAMIDAAQMGVAPVEAGMMEAVTTKPAQDGREDRP